MSAIALTTSVMSRCRSMDSRVFSARLSALCAAFTPSDTHSSTANKMASPAL